MLDVNWSRQRQARLLEVMREERFDAVVAGAARHVQYLTALRPWWLHQAAAIVFADGSCWLAMAQGWDGPAAADRVERFEADRDATLRQEQPMLVADLALEALRKQAA